MRLPQVLFAILLAMCAVVATTFVIGESPSSDVIDAATGESTRTYLGHGIPHPEFKSMLQGGDGQARHGRVLWFGWAFGMLQIALFVTLIAYGGQRNGRLGPLRIPILIAGLIYAGTFTAMVYSYQGYMDERDHATFLSLPIPTAWLVYGVWPVPVLFMFLYMFTFDSWTFRDQDMRRFEQIVAERARPEETGSD